MNVGKNVEFGETLLYGVENQLVWEEINHVAGRQDLYKKKKGQNRNSAPFKIQYPMKNRG